MDDRATLDSEADSEADSGRPRNGSNSAFKRHLRPIAVLNLP